MSQTCGATYVTPNVYGTWTCYRYHQGRRYMAVSCCPLAAVWRACVTARRGHKKKKSFTESVENYPIGYLATIPHQSDSPKRMACREYAPGGYRIRMKEWIP